MNIQTFINKLSESKKKDYSSILSNFDFSKVDFSEIENWLPNSYTRNCFYCDQHFELILICWGQEQETTIHSHDGKDCWVYLLDGEMEEVFYKEGNEDTIKKVGSRKIKPNQLTYMNDTIGFHKLKNSYNGKSRSLHLYAKPIKNCKSFDETSQQFTEKELSYDTFKKLEH